MKSIDLLNKYPLSTEVIRKWFFNKLVESMNTVEVPQEFKDSVVMIQEAITNKRLATLIDAQPRTLFDVFDENDISINIERTPMRDEIWVWGIMQWGEDHTGCSSRKEAETKAIIYSFEVLEKELMPNIEEN